MQVELIFNLHRFTFPRKEAYTMPEQPVHPQQDAEGPQQTTITNKGAAYENHRYRRSGRIQRRH